MSVIAVFYVFIHIMIKHLLCSLATLLLFPYIIAAQSLYPGQFAESIHVTNVPTKAKCFELKEVRLLPSRFYDNLKRDSAWMMSISTDRLLHSFYNNSGVWGGKEGGYMTVKKLGGWESLDCELRGHTTGHMLSALALIYAATGNDVFKVKSDSIVAGLAKVQEALGNGYLSAFPEELINRNIRGEAVWAPWYTLHKILSGLIDQYLYTDNAMALTIARKMGDWAATRLEGIDESVRARMLRNEFGGINEAFYNLYAITGDCKYKNLAEFFYHNEVIDPLKIRNDDFGTKHTNTFIPKVLGEVRNYELSGDVSSRLAAEFFWDEMTGKHIFASGSLSDKEHFFPLDDFSDHITGYTGETCCTYNMLKLGRHLFCINADAKIFDYYERALYNHILAQQDPQTGMVTYFLPMATGTHKVYSTPENSFWCCVGSGFENHAKYAESVYFKSSDSNILYVNLFIPSTLNWEEKGLKLKQTNNFPADLSTNLTLIETPESQLTLKIRCPQWAEGVTVKLNGKSQNVKKGSDGYVPLQKKWKIGDKVEVAFDTRIRIEESSADNLVNLFYGPVLLAGRLGKEGMEDPAPDSNPGIYNDYYTYDYHIPDNLPTEIDIQSLRQTAPLRWKTHQEVTVEPLYDVNRERHIIYWNLPN